MQRLNESAERYVTKVSINPEMSHNKLLSRIRKNSKVLEFGPASGAMTQVLCESMGCQVSIVEIDQACYQKVMRYADKGVCADIEQLTWEKEFEDNSFDYIILADVLEHLKDPERILQEVRKYLKPEGSVLISVPNIAHNSIILQLIKNQFIYQSTGILDYTHVRHFTFSEIEKLCINAGFGVVYMDAVYIGVGKNEFDISYADVDPYLAEILRKRPLGEVYQHILEIKKSEYVEEKKVKIENCLGNHKDCANSTRMEQETQNEKEKTANAQLVNLLCENPNFFFETNDEIARLRLKINEIYQAEESLAKGVEFQKIIEEKLDEIRTKNQHINKLLEEGKRKDERIIELQKEEQKRNEHIARLDLQIEELTRQLEVEQERIRNKEGHIEQLLEVERAYEREKQTRSYKFGKCVQKFGDLILPPNSKRRFLAGVLFKVVRHPKLMLRVINPKRIKNYFKYMKKEGMAGVIARYNEAVEIEKSHIDPASSLDLTFVGKAEKCERKTELRVEDFEKIILPVWETPRVSILIPVYNEFQYTYNCINSIVKNSGDVPYEIIVANDCSTDITGEIETIIRNVRLITTENNVRFLINCNNAAKYAKGQYILFLNNDTQVQKNWLEPLVTLIESDDSIGMVGSKLVYPDGRLQEAGGILWKDGSAWNYGYRSEAEAPEYNYVKEVDYISGAAVMIRKSLWEEIGGFDERFVPAYYEDTDLAFEVRKHGYKVMYQPLSVVVHFEGISNGTNVNEGVKAYQVDNQKKFYEKWKAVLEQEHFPNAENVFLAKDRSQFKKHILVVDHYVPHHDQDAGGKCTYMYLKLFVKMGLKVTFIGDNFYKHEPYTTELTQMGIEVLYGNYYYNNWQKWLKENGHYFDYVYLQRPHISVKYIDLMKKYTRAKIFYFAHDLHHIREYREYEITGDEKKLKSSKEWKKIEYELFEKTDIGHVVGSYEQGIMQKAFPNTPVRNIPLYIYEQLLEDINKNFSERSDLLYVGGFGHSPNVDAVLWFAKEVFPIILKRYPTIKWHVVGSKPTKVIQELASENIIIEGFLTDEELHKLYRESRMAVVPLRYGAGVKGKVVEAAYYQIPLVTTSIGAEGLNCDDNPFIVEDNADKMAAQICEIYEDFDRLKDLSDKGKAFIEKNFTLEVAESILKMDMEL